MATSNLPFTVELRSEEANDTITLFGYDVFMERDGTRELIKHFPAAGCGMEKAYEAAWEEVLQFGKILDMVKARDHGAAAARSNLSIGNTFFGAAIQGEGEGYMRGTALHTMFMHGYLDVLHEMAPYGIRTDEVGTITELVTKAPQQQKSSRRRRA